MMMVITLSIHLQQGFIWVFGISFISSTIFDDDDDDDDDDGGGGGGGSGGDDTIQTISNM